MKLCTVHAKLCGNVNEENNQKRHVVLKWVDRVFEWRYLSTLSNDSIENRSLLLSYIDMKVLNAVSFIKIGATIATQ